MSNNPVIDMHEIVKTFPGVIALDHVNFQVEKGEVHVLLGENGAGKSTLVKILSGAYPKTKGRVIIDGKEVNIANPRHAQNLGIAIIYQELNLVPHLNAAENIFLGREPQLIPGIIDRNRMSRMAQEQLDALGVHIQVNTPVKELGVAQQQMVEVAKALSMNARIVIMDEPTSALTDREIEELFRTIRQLRSQGVSIIYISHRLEELFNIGDRVTVLRDGKCVGTLAIEDTDQSSLIRMMVNRELTEQYPRQPSSPGDEVLRIEKLSRSDVLKSISFSLKRGEILGIAGLLGSGRTELVRAVFGADRRDSGEVIIKGRKAKKLKPRTSIRSGIGYLTEDRKSQGLILGLSVKANICLASTDRFSRWGYVQGKQEALEAAKYVKELRIKTPGLHQKVMHLSGGNQQKVVMSKWLCSNSDILIFDEPTRGIDVGSKVEIYEWMNRLTASGVGIIMISSDLPEILGMSDRILVMHRGRICGEFTAQEASQERILECALGVKND
ncbi:D-xylose ABC transporter ATP-binding protein [bacterium I07]|nr:D-xylose ABC transporter ATP-binding protein [bacterium I07]